MVDREDALAAFDIARDSPRDTVAVVVVSGPPGIGKSAVALHWAQRARGDFPDGQLYADLRAHSADEPALPSEVLGQFIWALGIAPARIPSRLEERTALYRSLTAGRRLAIVLDDAQSAAQVRPLVPASERCLVIVTSRFRLGGLLIGGARAVPLDRLSAEGALDLLRQKLGPGRVGAEPAAARSLVELCDRFPLALCVASARLVTRPHWPLSEMVEALEQERLDALSVHAEDDMTIRAPLTLSYRALPAPVGRLYRLLGLYPGATFDSRAAAVLGGVPRPEAKQHLGVLTDANLLDDAPGGRYHFHDLTRLHARETAMAEESEGDRQAALRRVARWALHAAGAASRVAAPYRRIPLEEPAAEPMHFADSATALDWLDVEFRNLRAIAQWSLGNQLPRLSWRLVDAVWPLFLHRGHTAERLEFDLIGLAAARQDQDPEAEAKMLNRTGLALQANGRLDEAATDFRQALDLWRRLGSVHRVAGTYRRLGAVELHRERPAEALAYFEEALSGYRSAGERRREALTLCDIGRALISDDRPAEAVGPLERSAAVLAETGDPFSRAQALILLGRARVTDDPRAAQALAEEGLREMRRIGSRNGEVTALKMLARLAALTGQDDEALRYSAEYRRVLVDLGGSDS